MPVTQGDMWIRVVSLNNLEAMCERVSGVMAHTFKVASVSREYVRVTYSNETERGVKAPITVPFKIVATLDGTPFIALDLRCSGRVTGYVMEDPDCQSFQILLDCPVLWRSPYDGFWYTEEEIKAKQVEVSLAPLGDAIKELAKGKLTCCAVWRWLESGR